MIWLLYATGSALIAAVNWSMDGWETGAAIIGVSMLFAAFFKAVGKTF